MRAACETKGKGGVSQQSPQAPATYNDPLETWASLLASGASPEPEWCAGVGLLLWRGGQRNPSTATATALLRT
jgi:hypothetical protein